MRSLAKRKNSLVTEILCNHLVEIHFDFALFGSGTTGGFDFTVSVFTFSMSPVPSAQGQLLLAFQARGSMSVRAHVVRASPRTPTHTAHVLPVTHSQCCVVFFRILSHNPLSVIADTSFFKLSSVKYL